MAQPTPPRILVFQEPTEKRFMKKGGTDAAFEAQAKLTNFGLELMKFLSPAELGLYAIDIEEDKPMGRVGSQLFSLTTNGVNRGNNEAWWAPQQMYLLDDKGVVSRDDGKQDAHGSLYTDIKGFYSRVHRPSPIFNNDLGLFEGTFHGSLRNVNIFAGVAGGYDNAAYDAKNTWNHFEITEGEKSNWDYGISDSYQSAFKFTDEDNADWRKMQEKLAQISRQAIRMKDAQTGYDHPDFHTNFQSPALWGGAEYTDENGVKRNRPNYQPEQRRVRSQIFSDPNPALNWIAVKGKTATYVNDVTAKQNTSLQSVAQHPYARGEQTQAPNYFEIIHSGAWAKWHTDNTNDQMNDPANISNNLGSNVENDAKIDGEKFYYFLKAMLESRRRGYEALRTLLGGKVKDIPMLGVGATLGALTNGAAITGDTFRRTANQPGSGESSYADGNLPSADWNKILGEYDILGTGTRAQAARIAHTYNTLSKNTHSYNSFYNVLFYKITHQLLNQMDSLAGSGPSYSDSTEYERFREFSINGAYKYLWGTSGNDGELSRVAHAAGLGPAVFADGKLKLDPVNHPATYDSDGNEQTPASTTYNFEININNISSKADWRTRRDNLKGIYDLAMTKFIEATTPENKTKWLKIVNAVAPVAEFFMPKVEGVVGGVDGAKPKVPIVNFATSIGTYNQSASADANANGQIDVGDVDWDYIPMSNWAYYGSKYHQGYDGWVQLRGSGTSYQLVGGKRDSATSIAQINPLPDETGSSIMRRTGQPGPDDPLYDGDEINFDRGNGSFDTVRLIKALDLNRANATYIYQDGRAYYNPVGGGWTGRGAMREIEENPAYAAATYYYQTLQERQKDILQTMSINLLDSGISRQEHEKYEEKMEEWDKEQYKEEKEEATSNAKAEARQKRLEMMLKKMQMQNQIAENKKAQQRKAQQKKKE